MQYVFSETYREDTVPDYPLLIGYKWFSCRAQRTEKVT